MTTSSSDTSGLGGHLRALGDRLLACVGDRIELVSIELQEEKFRLIQTFVWISSVIYLAMMAVVFASITLVYAFAEEARLMVLGVLTALHAGALIIAVIAFRRYLARQPRPFHATLEEIEKDRACIPAKS